MPGALPPPIFRIGMGMEPVRRGPRPIVPGRGRAFPAFDGEVALGLAEAPEKASHPDPI